MTSIARSFTGFSISKRDSERPPIPFVVHARNRTEAENAKAGGEIDTASECPTDAIRTFTYCAIELGLDENPAPHFDMRSGK
jgi:hypothetical protein